MCKIIYMNSFLKNLKTQDNSLEVIDNEVH